MSLKVIKNLWPVYQDVNGELSIDENVARALEEIIGGGRRSELALKCVENYLRFLGNRYANTANKNMCLDIDGLAGILVALSMAQNEKQPDLSLTHIGMTYVRIMHFLGKDNLLKETVDICRNIPSPSVMLGLLHLVRSCSISDGLYGKIDDLARQPVIMTGNSQKEVVMKSAIAEYRRGSVPVTDLDKAEDMGASHPQAVLAGDVKTAVMWMMRDPYGRLGKYDFDWDKLPETRDAIRERFPFALPPRYDLDTRTAEDILGGLMKIWSFPRYRVVMDPYIIEVALKAVTRLMDTGVPNKEVAYITLAKFLSFCLFMKDGAGFARRILRHLPKGFGTQVVLYTYKTCSNELAVLLPLLYRSNVMLKLTIQPVDLLRT